MTGVVTKLKTIDPVYYGGCQGGSAKCDGFSSNQIPYTGTEMCKKSDYTGVLLFGPGNPMAFAYGMMWTLLVGTAWLLWATLVGYNVSSTHSIIGGIIGFALSYNKDAVNWIYYEDPFAGCASAAKTACDKSAFPYSGVMPIVITWFFAPCATATVSACLFLVIRTFVLRSKHSFERSFWLLPIFVFLTMFICIYFVFTKGAAKTFNSDPNAGWSDSQSGWVSVVIAAGCALICLGCLPLLKTRVEFMIETEVAQEKAFKKRIMERRMDKKALEIEENNLNPAEKLPVGWMTGPDSKTGKICYVHQERGITQYEPPAFDYNTVVARASMLVGTNVTGVLPRTSVIAKREGSKMMDSPHGDNIGIGIPGPLNGDDKDGDDKDTKSMDSLPEGWVEALDPASGKPYWANPLTGVSTWVRPEVKITVLDDYENDEAVRKANNALHARERSEAPCCDDKKCQGCMACELRCAECMRQNKCCSDCQDPNVYLTDWFDNCAEPAGCDNNPQCCPPEDGDWKEYIDPATEQSYWINRKTRETTWIKPVNDSRARAIAEATRIANIEGHYLREPEGWRLCQEDCDSKSLSCCATLIRCNERSMEKDRQFMHEAVLEDGGVSTVEDNAETFDQRTEASFKILQVFSACCVMFAHGSGEVGYMAGPLSTIWNAYNNKANNPIPSGASAEYWVLVLSAASLVIGLALYGKRVTRVVGKEMAKVSAARGFSAELSTAVVIMIAAQYGLPTSSSQCITGGIVGIGIVEGAKKGVNWKVFGFQFASWIVTIFVMSLGVAAFFKQGLEAPQRYTLKNTQYNT